MKAIIAILVLAGAALGAHAYEGGYRTFEITVHEVLPEGKVASVGGPAIITVRCGKSEEVRLTQKTTYPTNPPQPEPGVVFAGHVETAGCKP